MLKLAWCGHDAALYAVTHWHYTKSLPMPPVLKIGAWENRKFIGVVLFSRGASDALGRPYGLDANKVCELTRVALNSHQTSVSRILAISVKMLKKQCPGLKLVVSYADSNNGHHGGIYQASNWIYTGKTAADSQYVDQRGRIWHSRQISATGFKKQFGKQTRVTKTSDCKRVLLQGKHRYILPLDAETKKQVIVLTQPYPKRATSIGADAPGFQSGEGGSQPTVALHLEGRQKVSDGT